MNPYEPPQTLHKSVLPTVVRKTDSKQATPYSIVVIGCIQVLLDAWAIWSTVELHDKAGIKAAGWIIGFIIPLAQMISTLVVLSHGWQTSPSRATNFHIWRLLILLCISFLLLEVSLILGMALVSLFQLAQMITIVAVLWLVLCTAQSQDKNIHIPLLLILLCISFLFSAAAWIVGISIPIGWLMTPMISFVAVLWLVWQTAPSQDIPIRRLLILLCISFLLSAAGLAIWWVCLEWDSVTPGHWLFVNYDRLPPNEFFGKGSAQNDILFPLDMRAVMTVIQLILGVRLWFKCRVT